MKNFKFTYRNTIVIFITTILTFALSCTFDEEFDPNRPSLEGVLTDASVNQLNNLVVGVESGMRGGVAGQTTHTGTMARELYKFDADPRNTGDLLGANGASLDNNSFYSTSVWASKYRTIKNANILLEALDNTSSVSIQEAAGYSGFVKTVIAHQLIMLVKSYGSARVDVSDPTNPGPILQENDVLSQVSSLLDEAQSDLSSAGSSFSFPLAGFSGFDTPSTFTQFNRAVKALALVYSGNKSGALQALTSSYFDLNGDLKLGPKHVFSLSAGDFVNGLYKIVDNNGDQIIVHNSFINDAESGDTRVSEKTIIRSDPTTQDGLNGTHQTKLYASNISPIDIIRNEELILLYAEANIPSNNSEAVKAINVVRNAAGLSDYSGSNSESALIDELLKQRRYSLWCENHRMYDLRRYGKSSSLPIDRPGDQVFNIIPIPLTENE
tara:strand:+ start:148 stop:1464 length:1317 start_codon:yes stop_codon:yes gene_type:complete